MPRYDLLSVLLAAATLASCGSSTDVNQPGGVQNLPPNGISIVVGAQNKGSAAFSPNPLSISLASGGVAKWFNNDQTDTGAYGGSSVSHNIAADDGSFASGILPAGATFEGIFTTAGTHGYHCSIHPSMTGTVVVAP